MRAGCKAKLQSASEHRLSCLGVAVGRVAWKPSCDLILGLTCQHYCWRLDLLLRERQSFWMLVLRRPIDLFGYFSSVSTNYVSRAAPEANPQNLVIFFNTAEPHLLSPDEMGPRKQFHLWLWRSASESHRNLQASLSLWCFDANRLDSDIVLWLNAKGSSRKVTNRACMWQLSLMKETE